MIGYAILLEVVRTDLFTTVATANLNFTTLSFLFHVFEILLFEHFLFEDVDCFFAVSLLDSIFLNEDRKSCWNVSCPTGTLSFVNMLTTSSLSPHKVISHLFLIKDEVKWHSRHHSHRNS